MLALSSLFIICDNSDSRLTSTFRLMTSRKTRNAKRTQQGQDQNRSIIEPYSAQTSNNPESTVLDNLPSSLSFDEPPQPQLPSFSLPTSQHLSPEILHRPRALLLDLDEPPPELELQSTLRIRGGAENPMDMDMDVGARSADNVRGDDIGINRLWGEADAPSVAEDSLRMGQGQGGVRSPVLST